jgi:hypothetical protein
MKESYMLEEDWRIVQIFLGEDGISEVEVNSLKKNNVRCTCPKYVKSSKCAHVTHVKKVMNENDGHYEISIPVDIDEEDALVAAKDAETFRAFILKYGKVEVL